MISAVDTNVLIDVLARDPQFEAGSRNALMAAFEAGALVVCEAVYGELAANFVTQDDMNVFLADAGIRLDPSGPAALQAAGRAWRDYVNRRRNALICPAYGTVQAFVCPTCGRTMRPRQHLLSDFLIGAHALVQADQLITRDRGYFTTYFPDLTLVP